MNADRSSALEAPLAGSIQLLCYTAGTLWSEEASLLSRWRPERV
jgi:hypothetical protein